MRHLTHTLALVGLISFSAGCGSVNGPTSMKDAAGHPDESDAAIARPADSAPPRAADAAGPDGATQAQGDSDGALAIADVAATPADVAPMADVITAAPDTAALDTAAPAADAGDLRCPGVTPPADFDLVCGCTGTGKIRCDGSCSEADDSCTITGQWYEISNMFQGEARVLDTYGGASPNVAFIGAPCCSGGAWNITAAGEKYYRLSNQYMPTRSLESKPDGSGLFLGTTGDLPAQLWSIRAVGQGYFRITNKLVGPGRSMDTPGDKKDVVYLGKTGNYSGQYWKFKKRP
jgi:hypothetical protein